MKVIVIGAGQVGLAIIGALSGEKIDVVAIDKDEFLLDQVKDLFDVQIIKGSGSSPTCLVNAGISSADMVVAVTNIDEVNMVACSIAAAKSPYSIKVARIREMSYLEDSQVSIFDKFGINFAINPELVTAKRVNLIIKTPNATDVVDPGYGLLMMSLRIRNKSPVTGKTFAQLRTMAPSLRMLVTTRIRDSKSIVPKGDDDVRSGDVLYVIIARDDLIKLSALVGSPYRLARRIVIAGGSSIGVMLAQSLEQDKNLSVKLIEEDSLKADSLAESLSDTLVLKGSPTEDSILLEENIRDCDVFVAALQDEEANVMAALNAKRLGVQRVIALTNKTGYIPIIENVGIDSVISPRSLAIGTILHHIRHGKVDSVIPFGLAGQGEIIKFQAVETAKVTGVLLKDLKLPASSIVGIIIRDDTAIIPDGNDRILPGDQVLVCTEKSAIKRLEKLFAASIHYF